MARRATVESRNTEGKDSAAPARFAVTLHDVDRSRVSSRAIWNASIARASASERDAASCQIPRCSFLIDGMSKNVTEIQRFVATSIEELGN